MKSTFLFSLPLLFGALFLTTSCEKHAICGKGEHIDPYEECGLVCGTEANGNVLICGGGIVDEGGAEPLEEIESDRAEAAPVAVTKD